MAAQAGLCLAWSETPEDTFSRVVAQMQGCFCDNVFCKVYWDNFERLFVLCVLRSFDTFRSFRARSVNLATLFLGKPPRQFTGT